MSIEQAAQGSGPRGAGTKTPPPAPPARRLRPLLAAGAVALVAVLVALLVFTGGDDDPSPTGAGTATETSAPGAAVDTSVPPAPPTPEPTGPTENVDSPPPALSAVPIDAPAEVGNGIVATIADIEAIEGTAVGPGNIAGPALRLTVRIENGTAEAVSLAGVAVNLAYGSGNTPASPLGDPSQRPFQGMVDPGGSAEGVYVFSVPADARDTVTVEVGYQAGAPLLLFTGQAA